MQSPRFERAVAFTHRLVRDRLGTGDRAIDATAGNGGDTVFLAKLVGDRGKVIAFDCQQQAVERTRARCHEEDLSQVDIHQAGHETMADVVDEPVHVIMFNLGYLPSGDKSIVTGPATTLTALDSAIELLADGGLLTIAIYEGHPGGKAEGDAVREWAAGLDQEVYTAIHYGFLNQRNDPPKVVAVERR